MIHRQLYYLLPYETRRRVFSILRASRFRRMQWLRQNVDKGTTYTSFDDLRCIFVHVPRTAGVAVCESLFGNLAGSHTPLFSYQNIFSKTEFYSYFKFSFVRNPWDRIYSAYMFLKGGGMHRWDRAWAEKWISPFSDYEHFVRDALGRKEVQSWVHFRPQTHFVCVPTRRKIELDYLGRFENLENDFRYVASQIGKDDAALHHVNKALYAPADRVAGNFSRETMDTISRLYREDIELLGY